MNIVCVVWTSLMTRSVSSFFKWLILCFYFVFGNRLSECSSAFKLMLHQGLNREQHKVPAPSQGILSVIQSEILCQKKSLQIDNGGINIGTLNIRLASEFVRNSCYTSYWNRMCALVILSQPLIPILVFFFLF